MLLSAPTADLLMSAARQSPRRTPRILALLIAFLLGLGGLYQFVAAEGLARRALPPTPPLAHRVDALIPATVARMDSPVFAYSPGWRVDAEGADPPEPADPMLTPSGVITFTYHGNELGLRLAVGEYWGFLYVTVDGEPANLLPHSRNHALPAPQNAGYRPLLAPELAQEDGSPHLQWVRVHRAPEGDESHTVRIDVWRSWGQTPIRAVAVDALPPAPYPLWPGALLVVAAIWFAAPLWSTGAHGVYRVAHAFSLPSVARRLLDARNRRRVALLAAAGFVFIVMAIQLDQWVLGALGMLLLGAAGVVRPALWFSALLFGLPFYYSIPLPLLPTRAVNLIDTGVFLGLGVALAHSVLVIWSEARVRGRNGRTNGSTKNGVRRTRFAPAAILLLALLASWALVSTVAAARTEVALREWRTVFLMGATLAAGLLLTLRFARTLQQDSALLIGGWLAGATGMAALVLALYPAPEVTIPAEGVMRLRGFYGSPNNLALYLGRTLAVTLALALFAPGRRLQIACTLAALVQSAALVLTFSRGGILVALPVMVATLWVGGFWMLRRAGRPVRVLWVLVLLVALVGAALLPFVRTERVQEAVTLAQGTGFLRINLWRSAWQMALDHPLLGVGPDNFLYAYRSGYILPQAWMEPNLNHPHTWLLDWWVRIGLPGMVLGLLFWSMVVLGMVRGMAVRGWAPLYVGLLAATLTALAHGLLDVSYALPDLMAVWALFGVLASVELPTLDA